MKIIVNTPYSHTKNVTVQFRTSEGHLDECNHAGAMEQPVEFVQMSHYDGGAIQAPDEVYLEHRPVCDKCKAWKNEFDEWIS